MSLPGVHPITLYQGDTDRLSFQWLRDDANRTPVNLTGSMVKLVARNRFNDSHPVLELEAFLDDAPTGQFSFNISSAVTKQPRDAHQVMVAVWQ